MTKRALVGAFFSGLIFAVGLGISGMTQPTKVIGFLDIFGGAWDPSLGLVMAAAIAVHAPFAAWMRPWIARRAPASRAATSPRAGGVAEGCGAGDSAEESDSTGADDELSSSAGGRGRRRDGRAGLWLGPAIFGVGWGLGGYCPGPALVSLVSLAPGVLIFVAAMVAGMVIFHLTSQTPIGSARRALAASRAVRIDTSAG